MKIKKNDNVVVIAGKDKGKTGKVIKALPERDMIIIAGINMKKKHQRPQKSGQKGQIIEKTLPIHVSNAMIIDPSTGKRSRVGMKMVGDKYIRVSKKSGKEIS
ncbi:MAG: 50S ribosomal protein L24 [Patescibacteria group bacterium]